MSIETRRCYPFDNKLCRQQRFEHSTEEQQVPEQKMKILFRRTEDETHRLDGFHHSTMEGKSSCFERSFHLKVFVCHCQRLLIRNKDDLQRRGGIQRQLKSNKMRFSSKRNRFDNTYDDVKTDGNIIEDIFSFGIRSCSTEKVRFVHRRWEKCCFLLGQRSIVGTRWSRKIISIG